MVICFFFYNHSTENWCQSVCLYLSVSVCLPVYLSLSVHMRVCPTVSSVCLFVSVYPSICLCVFVRLCLWICRSFWPFSETEEGREIVADKQAKKAGGRRNIKLRSQRGIQRNDSLTLLFELLRANYKPFVLRTFARRVFPQPGGPASRIPGGWVRPSAWNSPGYFTGAWQDGKSIKLNIVTQKTKPKTLGFSVSWLKILLLIPQGQLLQLPKRDYILNDDFTSAEVILTG